MATTVRRPYAYTPLARVSEAWSCCGSCRTAKPKPGLPPVGWATAAMTRSVSRTLQPSHRLQPSLILFTSWAYVLRLRRGGVFQTIRERLEARGGCQSDGFRSPARPWSPHRVDPRRSTSRASLDCLWEAQVPGGLLSSPSA